MGRAKQMMMDAEADDQSIVSMLTEEGAAARCEFHDYAIDQEDREAEERVAATYAQQRNVSLSEATARVDGAK